MIEYQRILDLNQIIKNRSHFLFGPRSTGKSWLISRQLPHLPVFDLLDSDVYTRFLKRPRQLGEELGEHPVAVIDEIQKLPALLDEVHRLIEKAGKTFLLTGSSARKLKKGGGNLLGGRARSAYLYPLTSAEIPDFNLERYVNIGGLPFIHNSDDTWGDLREYVNLYLKEEIQAEAAVRRLDHFARFLDVMGLSSGKEINIATVSSESGVPARTIANYLEILRDTLLAFELPPFGRTRKRKGSSRSKWYLFDVGVANYLAGRKDLLPRATAFGEAFEHFILQEIRSLAGYNKREAPLQYWRADDFEVDLVIGDEMAVAIKSTEQVQDYHLRGLRALREENQVRTYHVVSRDPIRRKMGEIEVWPWREFLGWWQHS